MANHSAAQLAERIGQCLHGASAVAVAFSGGADSTALLIAASQAVTGLSLRAIHVNHAVNASASQWEQHCLQVAGQLDVPLSIARLNPGELPPHASETLLREARYRQFERLLSTDEVLLIAHHRNDVAETTLLALMRGGSPAELAGVPARRPLGRGWLARPFLDVDPATLRQLIRDAGLTWIEDPSNGDPRHPRSFLRHRVLPLLEPQWPQASQRIADSAERQRQSAAALREALDELVPPFAEPDRLPISALQDRSSALGGALLRRWLERRGVNQPAQSALDETLRQVRTGDCDSRLELVLDGACMRRYRDHLWLVRDSEPPPDQTLSWKARHQPLPGHLGALEWVPESGGKPDAWPHLSVRFGAAGLRIQPAGQQQRRTLKNLYQESGVPPWERTRTPLVYLADQPIMVGNLCKAQAMLDLEQQLHARSRWIPG